MQEFKTSKERREAATRMIEQKHGKVTPSLMFEEAKDPSFPVHGEFEWDVHKGWTEHNLNIARRIIASVEFTFETKSHGMATAPQYIRDPSAKANEQGYINIQSLTPATPAAYEVVIQECNRATPHLRRAHAVAIALGYGEEVEDILARIDALTEKVRPAEKVHEEHATA